MFDFNRTWIIVRAVFGLFTHRLRFAESGYSINYTIRISSHGPSNNGNFYKERINNVAVISIAVSTLEIVALGVQNSLSGINIKGLGVSLLSAFCYALYIVVVNKSRLKVSGFKLTFYSLLFSSAYYGCKMLIGKASFIIPEPKLLINLALLSLVCTVLSIIALV